MSNDMQNMQNKQQNMNQNMQSICREYAINKQSKMSNMQNMLKKLHIYAQNTTIYIHIHYMQNIQKKMQNMSCK